MLKNGSISNLPFTVQYVACAEQIWGKDIGTLKGKTKAQTPVAAPADTGQYVTHPL